MKWKQYLAVMTAAAMVISGPAVPMSQVFAADAVAAEVQADEETTDEKSNRNRSIVGNGAFHGRLRQHCCIQCGSRFYR